MKKMMPPILLLLLQTGACSDNTSQTQTKYTIANNPDTLSHNHVDTIYMQTGFYFLSEGQDGIRMNMEKANEIYTVIAAPFASVRNIIKTELKRTDLKNEIYTELCMTFDNKGAKDIEEGTGNPLHPKIAVIIANKLLYVVDNSVSIKTGVMCVGLVGYSEQEMEIMRKAVDNKK